LKEVAGRTALKVSSPSVDPQPTPTPAFLHSDRDDFIGSDERPCIRFTVRVAPSEVHVVRRDVPPPESSEWRSIHLFRPPANGAWLPRKELKDRRWEGAPSTLTPNPNPNGWRPYVGFEERTRTTAQHFWDTLKGWTPIAIQKWFKNPQDYSPIDSVLQSLGITSYPSRSDAAKAAQKYRGSDDPANQEKSAQTKDLQSRVAAGKLSADQVRQMATQQEITQGQAKTITRPIDPVVADFRRLPIEKALELWTDYTPEEQAKLAPELRKKAMSIGRLDRTSTQKQALTARVRAVLAATAGPTLQGSYNAAHDMSGIP